MPWLIHNLFKYLYKESLIAYLRELGGYILITLISVITTISVCCRMSIEGIQGLIIKGVISCTIPVIIQCMMYRKKKEFRESVIMLKKMLKKE